MEITNAGNSAKRRCKASSTRKKYDKKVSFFLCLFLGVFGAHKFYEDKTLTGVLYCCTVGLLGLGVIVDLITIMPKQSKYYI